ncbi:MAG: hypothetical protein K5866_09285 [Treponema sp.]|nr:hypothetical protein [Treponema sp.]
MGISLKEIVTGRKTFFITPDTSLIPESFLEDYFALGYECYFIENDKKVSIQRKLDILISIFHDVIFFFNIDFQLPDQRWEDIIRNITERYDNQACIGVLYTKRQTKDEKVRLEKRYLMDLGLSCGCIQLEYQKKQNFEIIEKILYANQAQGRRKNIRALCTKACTFSFNYNGAANTGVLQDISLSHFSFVYPEGRLQTQLYEKVADFHFNIRGFMFRSDAVLIMERPLQGEVLYIFAFTSSTGANGLDLRIKQLLIPNIYQLMAASCKNLLDQIFNKVGSNLDGLEEISTDEA